jgi:hypothetical protein
MSAKFEIKKAVNGQFYFNLKAANGEVILTSETYVEKEGAKVGLGSVKVNAALDERYERKTSVDNQHYFVLKAANGEIIGKSEMYKAAAGMEHGIQSVKTNATTASVEDLA